MQGRAPTVEVAYEGRDGGDQVNLAEYPSVTARVPPGLSTRAHSRKSAGLSGTSPTTSTRKTMSKLSSGKCICRPSLHNRPRVVVVSIHPHREIYGGGVHRRERSNASLRATYWLATSLERFRATSQPRYHRVLE
jgi:hypothetical protein